jgi:TolA-binding protein
MLRERAHDQEKQIRDVNLKAAELIEKQTQLAQGMIEQKQSRQSVGDLNSTLSDIASEMADIDDEDLVEHVKSWIEKA